MDITLYKVVEKSTRYGVSHALYRQERLSDGGEIYPGESKVFKRLKREYPDLFPQYLVGSVVTANPNSLGFLCFDTLQNAKTFLTWNLPPNLKIIRVRPLGEVKKVRLATNMFVDDLILMMLENATMNRFLGDIGKKELTPTGTVGCKKIEVLE